MIYHPESIRDEIYDLLDWGPYPRDEVWLEGDKDRQWGRLCRLRPLINGRWAYSLEQRRGENWSYSHLIRGMYTERYDAIAACIRELKLLHKKQEFYLERLKERAETEV